MDIDPSYILLLEPTDTGVAVRYANGLASLVPKGQP